MKRRILKISTAILFVAIIVTVAIVGALNSQKQVDTVVESGSGIYGEGGQVENGQALPSKMTFTQTADITLEAKTDPIWATNQAIIWNVEWVNANSEFATNKIVTDYLQIERTQANKNIAKVICKKPFGEQVQIIVQSEDNTNAKAECVVDYERRPENFNVKLNGVTDNQAVTRKNGFFNNKDKITYEYKMGIGTVDPAGFKASMYIVPGLVFEADYYGNSAYNDCKLNNFGVTGQELIIDETILKEFVSANTFNTPAKLKDFVDLANNFIPTANEYEDKEENCIMKVHVVIKKINAATVKTYYEKTFMLNFSYKIGVNDVSLSNSNLTV